VGKHVKIESSQRVASIFVPIPLSGLPKQLQVRNSARILAVSDVHQAADVTRPPFPEIWDDRARRIVVRN